MCSQCNSSGSRSLPFVYLKNYTRLTKENVFGHDVQVFIFMSTSYSRRFSLRLKKNIKAQALSKCSPQQLQAFMQSVRYFCSILTNSGMLRCHLLSVPLQTFRENIFGGSPLTVDERRTDVLTLKGAFWRPFVRIVSMKHDNIQW